MSKPSLSIAEEVHQFLVSFRVALEAANEDFERKKLAVLTALEALRQSQSGRPKPPSTESGLAVAAPDLSGGKVPLQVPDSVVDRSP